MSELALAIVVWELGFSETFWFMTGTDTEAAAVLSLLGPGTLELFLDFVNWMGGIGAKSISDVIQCDSLRMVIWILLLECHLQWGGCGEGRRTAHVFSRA